MITQATRLSAAEQSALIVLRTLIGWHFLYEGYFKLLQPAWSRAGVPLEPFSASGYLRSANGPLASIFQAFADSAWLPSLDVAVAAALLMAGLFLILGLLTQTGCAVAFTLLAIFYLSSIPLSGAPEPRTEGTYLIVNKNLIEAAAVLVLFVFRTGRLAGLDRLWSRDESVTVVANEAAA
jgi:thiosulfate dehydrogenase (quinone) large subunit